MTARASIPPHAVSHLERLLAAQDGLGHLAVKCRGHSLTLCSEDAYGPTRHAKLDWLGAELFGLSLPTRSGRWQRTPFTGSLDDLLQILTQVLGWHLAPR
jgi:hypothetical protein